MFNFLNYVPYSFVCMQIRHFRLSFRIESPEKNSPFFYVSNVCFRFVKRLRTCSKFVQCCLPTDARNQACPFVETLCSAPFGQLLSVVVFFRWSLRICVTRIRSYAAPTATMPTGCPPTHTASTNGRTLRRFTTVQARLEPNGREQCNNKDNNNTNYNNNKINSIFVPQLLLLVYCANLCILRVKCMYVLKGYQWSRSIRDAENFLRNNRTINHSVISGWLKLKLKMFVHKKMYY